MSKKFITEYEGFAEHKRWRIDAPKANVELIKNYFSRASDKKIPISNLTKSEMEDIRNQHFVAGMSNYENLFRKTTNLGKLLGLDNTNNFLGRTFSFYCSEVIGSEERIYTALSKLNICKTRDEYSELVSLMTDSAIECYEYCPELSETTKFKLETVVGPNREKNIKLVRDYDGHLI